MSRVIKFRLYFREGKKLTYSTHTFEVTDKRLHIMLARFDENTIVGFAQFTGLHDKNGKEIYEGDIFRVEEQADDRMYYLVIHWIKEWCMFGCLTVGEYTDYLATGISALDEPMFWTYTLEDTDSQKFFLCGNIYQNPKLIEP